MKRILFLAAIAGLAIQSHAALVITGVFDGPLSGGLPKGIELYATTAIGDLSAYRVANYNNGSTTSTATLVLSGSMAEGSYAYVVYDAGTGANGFDTFFGEGQTVIEGNVLNINGDDAVALLDASDAIVDVFGAIGIDGTGQPWEYLDGWAYRNDGAGPSATFSTTDWLFSGIDALDGATTNSTANSPFPMGTYAPIPEPAVALLGSVALLALLRRRR